MAFFAPTQPPQIKPPVISLINAARFPVDDTDGRWESGFAFLPLDSVAAWPDDPCASLLDVDALPAPGMPTVSFAAGASTLAAGVHVWVATTENANGETYGSTPVSGTAASGQQATVAWPAVQPDQGVGGQPLGYNLYRDGRRIASGLSSPAFLDTGQAPSALTVPTANTTGSPGSYPAPGEVDTIPPVLRAWDRCSSFGFEAHDYAQRANDTLDVATSAAIELEFWGGAKAQAAGWPNLYLANGSATVITPYISGGGVPAVARAIEALEQAISNVGAGGLGMIHCRPEAVPHLTQVRRQGNLLLTARDTIVVAGSGYPNLGPTGLPAPAGQTWMFATGLVDVRIGDISLFPDPAQDENWLIQATDRNTNEVVIRAERPGVAVWDGAVHFACLATLDT
jgi:hypothetical protein